MRTVYIYRRHTRTCGRKRGDNHRCQCPIWTDGILEGRRYRRSLETTEWAVADAKLKRLELGEELQDKPIPEAFAEWEAQLEVAPGTRRKYARAIRQLCDFLAARGLSRMAQLRIEDLDKFRAARCIAKGTLLRELQTWRLFLGWCVERRWLKENLAKRIKVSSRVKPTPVEPYSPEEIQKIVSACDCFGKSAYERLRAKALVLLLRYTGLRLSDALMLRRDRIQDGEILIYTQKAGTPVWMPVHPELQRALELCPAPRGAAADCPYYFWNGQMGARALLGIGERTLHRVFQLSGVIGAHAHRFRHTLAIETLRTGGTIEDVARILGNTPVVAYKHYAPWCSRYQDRIREVMRRVYQAEESWDFQSHHSHTEKNTTVIN